MNAIMPSPIVSPRPRLQRWIVLLLCWTAIPVLMLLLLEGGLRWGGYGVPAAPFRTLDTERGRVHVCDLDFLYTMFTAPPNIGQKGVEFAIPEHKEGNTYRIFVFGSSAAFGWTHSASFVQFLQIMLLTRYPGVRFEIYNLANGGLNSSIMRPLARAVAALEPDAFLIYMGNNEVHGPYGLISEFHVRPGRVPTAWQIRLHQWLRRSRTGQVMDDLSKSFLKKKLVENASPPLRYDDARVDDVWKNYAYNLTDMFDAGTCADAGVFVSTLGANLRHWPPQPDLIWNERSWEERRQFQALLEEGKTEEEKGDWTHALERYEQAEMLSDECPYLCFRQANCHWNLQQYDAARMLFERALELDSFVWVRAKKAFNATIQSAAETFSDPRVTLVNGKEYLEEASPQGIPGMELFADGCHFRPAGMYVLAKAFFDQMTVRMPSWVREHENSEASLPSREEILLILGLNDNLREDVIEQLIRKSEEHGMDSVQMLQKELEYIRAHPFYWDESQRLLLLEKYVHAGVEDVHLAYKYVECIRRMQKTLSEEQLTWLARLAERYACDRNFQHEYGQTIRFSVPAEEREAVYKRLMKSYPRDEKIYTELLRLYLERKETDKASDLLKKAQENHVDEKTLQYMQGEILNDTDTDQSIDFWNSKLQSDPEDNSVKLSLARALERKGNTSAAREVYQQLLEKEPCHGEALLNLAKIEILSGNMDKGLALFEQLEKYASVSTEFIGQQLGELAPHLYECGDYPMAIWFCRKALEKSPRDLWPQMLLGEIYEVLEQFDSAEIEYIHLLEKAPESPVTAKKLYDLQVSRIAGGRQDREEDANARSISIWRSLTQMHPHTAIPHFYLAMTLEQSALPEEAYSAYQQVLQLKPDFPEAQCRLGAIALRFGRLEDGMEKMREAVHKQATLASDAARVCSEMAAYYAEHQNYDYAVTLYHAALHFSPGDLWPRVRLGEMHERRGDDESAIDAYRNVLQQAPESPVTAARMAAVMKRLSLSPEKMLKEWRTLAELHPDAAIPLYYLGKSLEQNGEADAAAKVLDRAWILNPKIETDIQPTQQ